MNHGALERAEPEAPTKESVPVMRNDPQNFDGAYELIDDRPAIVFEREYAAAPNQLWSTVATARAMSRWFPSRVQLNAHQGGGIVFTGDPHMDSSTGTVTNWEPERHWSFTWGDSEVDITVEPCPKGSKLTFIEFLEAENTAARNAAGWHVCLHAMQSVLTGDTMTTPLDWEPMYRGYEAKGLPTGAVVPGINDKN
ncbi:SRPBCC domain-containing protein [Kocuria atrinae]|uniref:Activator of Hsp90 ATPase homologue 1/2-like C-terminal domain-containing protein n=1 Tax=Kocuria atrinae TaxID=592377 RepID=A0ABN2XDA8_9MICC|nr:SRPBCC domain-containing protein [Kocuria sp.]